MQAPLRARTTGHHDPPGGSGHHPDTRNPPAQPPHPRRQITPRPVHQTAIPTPATTPAPRTTSSPPTDHSPSRASGHHPGRTLHCQPTAEITTRPVDQATIPHTRARPLGPAPPAGPARRPSGASPKPPAPWRSGPGRGDRLPGRRAGGLARLQPRRRWPASRGRAYRGPSRRRPSGHRRPPARHIRVAPSALLRSGPDGSAPMRRRQPRRPPPPYFSAARIA